MLGLYIIAHIKVPLCMEATLCTYIYIFSVKDLRILRSHGRRPTGQAFAYPGLRVFGYSEVYGLFFRVKGLGF